MNERPELQLPAYPFRIKKTGGQRSQIFDPIRKKYVALTPEEWVRQHFVQYLVLNNGYPASLIAIEMPLVVNKRNQRSDVVVYDKLGVPFLIVECKAPQIKLTQNVFDQIARYNMTLKVQYLAVTNGLEHYFCFIDHENKTYRFLEALPEYPQK